MMLQLLVVCSFFVFVNGVKFSNDSLQSVVVIFRHGDRSPIYIYKNDPYNETFWPDGLGQLSNIGKRQHLALGKWYRAKYDDFLGPKYHKDDIKIYSSNVDRCLMSAESDLAGLYPPVDDQIWNENLPWQPIPVHTTPEIEDAVLAQQKPCGKYQILFDELMESDDFISFFNENKDLLEYLSENTGDQISTVDTIKNLYDTLFIEDLYNLTLPNWTSSVFPEPLNSLNNFLWTTYTYTTDMARLKAGPLLDIIITHFDDITSKTPSTPKFLILSAHDHTIANTLNAMKVFDHHSPGYASSIIFELRTRGGNDFLNIFYKNTTDSAARITLNDCDFNCNLNTFKKILEPVRINNEYWERECSENEVK